MKHLSNGALSSDVTFNANCITLMITEAVSELLHCIYVHLLLSLILFLGAVTDSSSVFSHQGSGGQDHCG